jgi:hypothetical protein
VSEKNPQPRGLAALASAHETGQPLLRAVGGVLGILETVVPVTMFVFVYALSGVKEGLPWLALGLSVGASVIFTLVRVIRRESVLQAIVGLVGVALSAAIAIFTGRAEGFSVWGLVTNGVYALAVIVSLAARWPLVGLVIGLYRQDKGAWRKDRESRRVYTITTLLWLAMFAIRLAVEVPLFVAASLASGAENASLNQALLTAKLALGLPLYVPVLAATWLLVRGLFKEKAAEQSENAVS